MLRRELAAIGDRQLHAGLLAARDHLAAFRDGVRHRLLAQHVFASPRRAPRELGVLRIRQHDENKIHRGIVREAVEVRVAVAVRRGNPVLRRQRAHLRRGTADQRGEAAVPRLAQRGNDVALREAAQTHDGDAELARIVPIFWCRILAHNFRENFLHIFAFFAAISNFACPL